MREQFRKKRWMLAVLPVIMLLFFVSTAVYAAIDSKIMASCTVDDHLVRIYVRGGNVEDDAGFQIGNTPTEKPISYSISEDSNPMRTLIMLDNSLSIPQDSRPKIIDLMGQVINNHSENEQFRIATFSNNINYLSDRYSDDYTSLLNIVNNIGFNNQDTLLTDVLYGVIDDLKVEGYIGYTRIIIITDGVNNKPVGGKSLDMIKDMLKTDHYPIYTVGCNTGQNDDLLDNLFSLSWLTDCEYAVFEDSKIADIAAMISADNEIVVYEAEIPEEIMDGTPRRGRLTLGDGTELVLDVNVPFSQKKIEETQEPTIEPTVEPTIEPTVEPTVEPTIEPTVEPTVEPTIEPTVESTEEQNNLPWTIIAGIATLIIIGIGAIVYFLVIKRKTKTEKNDGDAASGRQGTLVFEEGTGRQGTLAFEEGRTASFMPGGSHGIITITDKHNSSASRRCEIIDEISIGRASADTISFNDGDNEYMHAHHCRIQCVGGDFYIIDTELGKKRTHTKVNGTTIEVETPYSIKSGDEITIGNHTYIIGIEKA